MEQIFSCLHPHPGWVDSEVKESNTQLTSTADAGYVAGSNADMVGRHCILELYDCDQVKLNDEAFLRNTVTNAAKLAGATLLNLITHRFEPQGVTGLALLAESHISIHTWPENGYAAVDVFTCGDHTMPEKACEFLRYELEAENHLLKSFQRETPSALRATLRNPIAKYPPTCL